MSKVRGFVNGRLIEDSDPGNERASHRWASTLGPTLVTPTGEKPTEEVLANKKQVALFFAAQWCPWCTALEPKLRDVVTKVHAADPNDTEVVYVSTDHDEQMFRAGVEKLTWPAIPFARSQGVGETPLGHVRQKVREETGKPQGLLGAKFGIKVLPSLVVLDGSTGELLHEKFFADKGDKPADGFAWSSNAPTSWLEVAEEE
mmetsp:Transcript_37674/g.86966  ORF Transcript_37674/g.86966 Transcript_37674/m.86966 type:complete len:202 (-) Transcript_37674:116-721(-)